MARNDGSVMSSLQKLYVEEERRRAEQVALAQHRKLGEEREALEREARLSEQARIRAENLKLETLRRAADDRAESERAERQRAVELETVRHDLELRARLTLMQTEQAQELQRLALVRDQRLKRLEGQRLLLVALLGTMLAGGVLLYGLVLRPDSRRQEASFGRALTINQEQRAEFSRERERMEMRRHELEGRVVELEGSLAETKQKLRLAEQKRAPERARPDRRLRIPVATRTSRCVDNNDPLCASLE